MNTKTIIMSVLAAVFVAMLTSTDAWADTGSTTITSGIDATTLAIVVGAFIAPIIVIAYVFLFRWVRDVMADWGKDRQLEQISHSQTIATLGDIATGGQAQTGVLTKQGTKAVADPAQ